MAKDGSSKAIIHVPAADVRHADALVAALNATQFNSFFKFTHTPADDGVMVVATGQWSLPGNQRPAHGTMQTWADGYLAALKDAVTVPAPAGSTS